MAYLTRRLFHSSPALLSTSSAQKACTELLARFSTQPVSVRKQLLDANQLHLLNITLGRKATSFDLPRDETPIPPGYHLVYFTPSILEEELGIDGTDRTVNPLAPYSRRMWAGGELRWNQQEGKGLKVGQTVQETTKLISAEPKLLKTGASMLVVGVEKTFENDHGIALTDCRNWVFQQDIGTSHRPLPARPEPVPFPKISRAHHGAYRDFTQTPVSLFRFSALTFNAHKIHYLPEWCREVEGHRDAVVHGPLNLINMLDLWRDTARQGIEEAVPKSIAYRAMSPLYVGEQYRILLGKAEEQEGGGKCLNAEILDAFGNMAMKGTIIG
jgi:hydroxyacyl-ACP dehydratase HTD2-like protein with hotdog domain